MLSEKNTTETIEYFTPTLGLSVEPYVAEGLKQLPRMAKPIKQGIHHIARYQWASLVLADRRPSRVVDVACGAGYGSFMLARGIPGAMVVGVDYDARAVDHARATYRTDRLSYLQGSMVTWKTENNSIGECDAIVSFDTIEHLLHREIALENITRVLAPDGAMLFSTPCGHRETRLNPGWEHHKIEFSHKDLYLFLSRYFGRIIQPQDADFPHADYWKTKVNNTAVLYLNRMNPVVCLDPIKPQNYPEMRV